MTRLSSCTRNQKLFDAIYVRMQAKKEDRTFCKRVKWIATLCFDYRCLRAGSTISRISTRWDEQFEVFCSKSSVKRKARNCNMGWDKRKVLLFRTFTIFFIFHLQRIGFKSSNEKNFTRQWLIFGWCNKIFVKGS